MYEDYFSLSGPAFRLSPDPKFFFGSQTHNKAMAYLYYGLKQAEGFIVVTGDVGAGKTILIGHLMDQLHYSAVTAAHLQASDPHPDALLPQILSAFGVERERQDGLDAFERFLFEELKRGRHVLLIVDEAQNLPLETLEKLRALSSIDYDGTPLFQVFLIGRPEFSNRLSEPSMAQMRQRVIASYCLDGLTREETREYILHRLSVAGWHEDPVFSDDAIALIYEETMGAPRRINLLCNRIMLFCAIEKRHEVTREIAETVLGEMREEPLEVLSDENELHANEIGAAAEVAIAAPQLNSLLNELQSNDHESDDPLNEFDRLIASRRKPVVGESQDRLEATLSDVASAIAAAVNGDNTDFPGDDEDEYGALPQRETVSRSLDGMREDLREAGEMLSALRSIRQERAAALASGLSRADELLANIRRIDGDATS